MEYKNNKSQNTEQACPLCQVSEDTLEKLQQKGKEKKPIKKRKKPLVKIFIFLIVLGLAVFVFFRFFLNFSLSLVPEPSRTDRLALPGEQGNNANISQGLPAENIQEDIGSESENDYSAPDFISEDVYGNRISLSDFQNKKPVLLIFWATWCGFCAQELPDLLKFIQEHQNEIEVLVISSGESKETILNYVKEKGIGFPMILDEDREIWEKYSIRGTPSHFVIDKQKQVLGVWPGLASINDLETMLAMVEL